MDSNNNSSLNLDVYQIVTDLIIKHLEKGTVPWQKPWHEAGIPMNAISKRPYRGINHWLLLSLDYAQNLFLTYDQLEKIGGRVKYGEHGHVIVYWKVNKSETVSESEGKEQGKIKNIPLLRYYKVFNIAQCNGLPESLVEPLPIAKEQYDPILECEAIVNGMPECPLIKHKGQKAFYDKKEDYITMPLRKRFKDNESYYHILFHELIHSTGNEKRLNRATITEMAEFGSEPYSFEELVAELGSAYLSSFSGILTGQIKNSAAYINGWLKQLRNDKRFIVRASAYAQRAADFILNTKEVEGTNEVEQSEMLADD